VDRGSRVTNELECHASLVSNNPVDELTNAHALVVSGPADGSCPLTVSYDGSFVPPMAGHSVTVVHSCAVPAAELRSGRRLTS